MTTALWLLIYGAALAWLAPPLLGRLTRTGLSPQMAVAAWLTAVATTIIAWVGAFAFIAVASLDGIRDSSAVALCLELFGLSEHAGLPGLAGSLLLATVGLAVTGVVVARISRSVSRLWSRSREHANAVLLVGRRTAQPGVIVVDANRPAAYCVLGHPSAVVVTSAAWSSLSRSELAAVLAHERAHLTGRHHQILMVLRAMAMALPRLPLMRQCAHAVAELLEMCADDAAARRHGVNPLLGGLLALAEPHHAPAEGLAAAGTAVTARAMRLAEPACNRAKWSQRVILSLFMAFMLGAPGLIEFLCHH